MSIHKFQRPIAKDPLQQVVAFVIKYHFSEIVIQAEHLDATRALKPGLSKLVQHTCSAWVDGFPLIRNDLCRSFSLWVFLQLF